MQVTAIEGAIAQNDTPVVEAAFCALVEFPDGPGIEGARTVDALCRLLSRVARALLHDENALPSAIGGTIAAIVDEPASMAPTYAGGATVVSDHLFRWRGRYLEYAANGGVIG